MAFDFKLPDVGEGISEGVIVKWRIKVGDFVKEDDVLVDIDLSKIVSRAEADKQLAEKIPAPAVRKFLLKNLMREKNNRFRWKCNLSAIAVNIKTRL